MQAERQLKKYEQSFQLERKTIKEEVLIACENARLTEYKRFPNTCLPKEVKSKLLSAQSQSSNNFNQNVILKMGK